MNQLSIQAFSGEINHQTTTLVDARQLHAHLNVSTKFATWILRRIEEFGFIKNEDFIIIDPLSQPLPKNGKQSTTRVSGWFGESKIDYHLTLDMAKELCMVERSEIGRQARRYFIEIEKEHREAMPQWAMAQLADTQAQLHAAQELILQRSPQLRDIARYRFMGLTQREIGKLVGAHKDTVRLRYRELEAMGLFVDASNVRRGRKPLGLSSKGMDCRASLAMTAGNDAAQPSLIG